MPTTRGSNRTDYSTRPRTPYRHTESYHQKSVKCESQLLKIPTCLPGCLQSQEKRLFCLEPKSMEIMNDNDQKWSWHVESPSSKSLQIYVCEAFRLLDFGCQLAEHGNIPDLTAANNVFNCVKQIWEHLQIQPGVSMVFPNLSDVTVFCFYVRMLVLFLWFQHLKIVEDLSPWEPCRWLGCCWSYLWTSLWNDAMNSGSKSG